MYTKIGKKFISQYCGHLNPRYGVKLPVDYFLQRKGILCLNVAFIQDNS